MPETQTYATHRRFHPIFHFVAFPISLVCALIQLWHLVRHPGPGSLLSFASATALVLGVFLARFYGIRVQDRLIRLEETLRMRTLLPAELQARLGELRPDQCVGLRFASDAELPALVEQALNENLGGEAIKRRIQAWRPDTFRV